MRGPRGEAVLLVLRTPRTKQMGSDRFTRRVKNALKKKREKRAFLRIAFADGEDVLAASPPVRQAVHQRLEEIDPQAPGHAAPELDHQVRVLPADGVEGDARVADLDEQGFVLPPDADGHVAFAAAGIGVAGDVDADLVEGQFDLEAVRLVERQIGDGVAEEGPDPVDLLEPGRNAELGRGRGVAHGSLHPGPHGFRLITTRVMSSPASVQPEKSKTSSKILSRTTPAGRAPSSRRRWARR